MFTFKNKKIIYAAAIVLLVSLVSALALSLKAPALDSLRFPLTLLFLLKREINGFVFYHRNYLQNERLTREAEFLKHKIASLEEMRLENERLKNILSFKQDTDLKVIAARVVGRSADNWSSSVIIDRGRHHGIRRGMAVITFSGLAGRVIEETRFTGKVLLVNDPNISVSAMDRRSRQEGLVSGTLGSALIMRYLSLDSDVQISDEIMTSGLTEVYPKGLSIGTVIDVGEEFSGLSRYAVIKPTVDLGSLEEVLVVVQ